MIVYNKTNTIVGVYINIIKTIFLFKLFFQITSLQVNKEHHVYPFCLKSIIEIESRKVVFIVLIYPTTTVSQLKFEFTKLVRASSQIKTTRISLHNMFYAKLNLKTT